MSNKRIVSVRVPKLAPGRNAWIIEHRNVSIKVVIPRGQERGRIPRLHVYFNLDADLHVMINERV